MKSRLAYLVSQYPTAGHSFILREISSLRAQGFDIHVISVNAADRTPDRLTPDEREEWSQTRVIKSAGFLNVFAIHLRIFSKRMPDYLRGLRKALRLAGWDIERIISHIFYFAEAIVAGAWMEEDGITHFHSHFTSTVGLLLVQTFPLNMSITLHGPDEFADPVEFNLAEKVDAASFVCAISEFGSDQIRNHSDPKNRDKIKVVRLGVDPAIFTPRPFRESPEYFEIAGLGRLAPVKGFHVLLAAMELLVREGRKVRLRIGGDGPAREMLARDIQVRNLQDHVQLEGRLDAEGVLALLRTTDIFVLSSFAEGIPVVLMEAMSMEIPCVASRITGVPELIDDGVDGILVSPASPSEIANAVSRLIDDADLRFRLGVAARKKVVESYNLERNTSMLGEIFQERLSTARELAHG